MTLTTTTWHDVRAGMATAIGAITPTLIGNRAFVRAKKSTPLRDWTSVEGEAGFRAYEITRGSAEEPPLLDPAAYLRQEAVTVTVAYPLLLGLYGASDLDDVEKLIRSDARQIRDALFSSGNYVDGQQACLPLPIPEPDRGNAEVWYQSIEFQCLFYEAQSLT